MKWVNVLYVASNNISRLDWWEVRETRAGPELDKGIYLYLISRRGHRGWSAAAWFDSAYDCRGRMLRLVLTLHQTPWGPRSRWTRLAECWGMSLSRWRGLHASCLPCQWSGRWAHPQRLTQSVVYRNKSYLVDLFTILINTSVTFHGSLESSPLWP